MFSTYAGKWIGMDDNDDEVRHLLDAVRRDAVRTDPGNPFYPISDAHYSSRINLCESSDEDNIQKLVNIITIYTLEHGSCAYTQGMTDILSPILYVMKHEADAYICFSAMVERIRNHFETWCIGTLLKLERLKHLCEVLDPALYHHLKESIEEDAFALFFGMVLIECRREFSFEDSFHLLEAIWAAVACMKDSLPRTTTLSRTEWAHYMTQESPDVVQQVLGETQSPYSAVPLPRSDSMFETNSRSRQASMLSQGSMLPQDQFRSSVASGNPSSSRVFSHDQAIEEENEHSSGESSSLVDVSISEVPEKRPRSYTDPSDSKCSSRSPDQSDPSTSSARKKGITDSHSEGELHDSYNCQPPPVVKRKSKSSGSSRAVTEMSDMSSLSSKDALGNSCKSFDSRNVNGTASAGSDRSRSPARQVGDNRSPSRLSGDDGGGDSTDLGIDAAGERAMVELKQQHEDGKGCSTEASTPVAMDLHHGSSTKEPPTTVSPLTMNGVPPNPASSSNMSDDFQDAFSTLPDGNQREGQDSPAPSQPSSSEIYQTVTDDSSATDLPSRSISQSPALQHLRNEGQVGMDIPTMVNGDLHDPHPQDEEATPVHSRANGSIIQGLGVGEHYEADVLAGESLPFSPPELEEEGGGAHGSIVGKTGEENLTENTSHARSKSRGIHTDRHRSRTDPSRSSPLDIYEEDAISGSSRVTPVPFFDAMVQLASSAPGPSFLQSGQLHRSLVGGGGEEVDEENELEMSQANSMILSQLISTDRSAPRVTREKSLKLPVSDCFPLFICLSILVQNRAGIMRRNIDFVGLSVLLNTQAGTQDLDTTLDVAKNLYKVYREYQMTIFGSKPEDLDTWLDDDRTAICNGDVGGGGDGERSPANGDSHNMNRRTSPASDDVFTP
jgi:hypothetical protein